MTLIKSISGIRGTIGGQVGDALTPIDVVKFAAAYGTWQRGINTENKKIIVGRDARISGEIVNRLVAATLQSIGLDVIDLGLSTTPTVEMAVISQKAAGGIILTASHNPGHWNALKLLNEKGEFISGAEGEEILRLAEGIEFDFVDVDSLGTYKTDDDALARHIDEILKLPLVDAMAVKSADYRIVVDAVNSSGSIAVPALLEALGVAKKNIRVLNAEPNGRFAHNPEPLPEHLTEIISQMKSGEFDLGIVVDPDVDRLALISEDGTPFGEEYTLVAAADYVLSAKVGNTVSNLSSSAALRDITLAKGGNYSSSAVGEVNVVEEMKKTRAVIGGEGNGGIIYPDLHYGRDALVGIALILSYLAKSKNTLSGLRKVYPFYHISKNKIELTEGIDVDIILRELQQEYKDRPTSTKDGVRIDFPNEWVHLRKSNTEPIIRIYAESASIEAAEALAHLIKEKIEKTSKQ